MLGEVEAGVVEGADSRKTQTAFGRFNSLDGIQYFLSQDVVAISVSHDEALYAGTVQLVVHASVEALVYV